MRGMTVRSTARWIALVLILSACGGGGDGGSSPVTPPPVSPTITLSSSAIALMGLTTTQPVSATISPSTASVAWRTDNPSIATVAGSGTSATLTAVAGGTTQLVATVTTGALTAEARAGITVTPLVRAIVLSPLSNTLAIASTQKLTATIAADAGADMRLTWTSSDITRARVDTTGLVTAVAPGAVTIVATSVAVATVTGQASITVFEPARVRSVTVSPTLDSALVAETRTFTAAVVVDSQLPRTVTWRSSNTAIATISQQGVASAVAPGSITLTALSTVDTMVRSTATFVVRLPTVRAVAVAMRTSSVLPGDTVTLVPTITADPGASLALTFLSSAPAVATIDASGRVTAQAPGTTTLTATSVAAPAVKGTATLQVTVPVFPTRWTESNDGRTNNLDVLPAMKALTTLPSGVTLAVGTDGAIAEREGGVWRRVPSPTTRSLRSITVTGTTAWAAGNNGTILRRTTSGWVQEALNSGDTLVFIAIRDDGTGAAYSLRGNRVYERSAAGVWTLITDPFDALDYARRFTVVPAGAPLYANTPVGTALAATSDVMRWNGTSWVGLPLAYVSMNNERGAQILVLPGGELLSSGAENFKVYIARWNGATWTREFTEASGTTANFATLIRCADGSVVAATLQGALLRRIGNSWNAMPLGSNSARPDGLVACASPSDVVGGGTTRLWHYDGGAYSYEAFSQNYNRLSVGSASNIWTSATGSDLALQFDGTAWRPVPLVANGSFNGTGPALAAFPGGGILAYAGDFSGTRSGTVWNWVTESSVRPTELWGASSTDLWSAGSWIGSAGGVAHKTGATWTTVTPSAYSVSDFVAVHGASANAVMVVRGSTPPVVGRWNGATMKFDTVSTLFGLMTDVAVLSATEAMVVGNAVNTYRWNGTVWTPVPWPYAEQPLTVAGRLPNEYYVFGTSGGIYGLSGGVWRRIGTTSRIVRRARMTSDVAIGVGDDGIIVYGQPTGAGLRALGKRP